jgi:hypothetical protein
MKDFGVRVYNYGLERASVDCARPPCRCAVGGAGRRGTCESTTQRRRVTIIEGTSPSGRPTHERVTDAEETTTSTLTYHASPHQAHGVGAQCVNGG